EEPYANLMEPAGHCKGGSFQRRPMHSAIVDDDAPINLDRRAIVTRRVERVLAIAIDTEPTAPFDAELLLRERRRIRHHEVEIDLSLDAHDSRVVAPARIGVERHGDAALRPH